jgi:hypothetical protein
MNRSAALLQIVLRPGDGYVLTPSDTFLGAILNISVCRRFT